ncbi:MAG: hypothetical protein ACYST5_01515 [Planctomycetota bacterium]
MPAYTGSVYGDALASHDGGLRWVVGVQNVQIVRSAPENPSQTDGKTTIYRHHPFIVYWNGKFWVMYDGPGNRIAWSTNGFEWDTADSSVLFPDAGHHRMGFYVASNGRLLGSVWRGRSRGEQGVRLFREIYGPNSYGDVYAIKVNYKGPHPRRSWPDYKTSSDKGFVAACDEFRNNRLSRQQWQEEDQDPDFYTISNVHGNTMWKAFSWYRLPDNRIVGTWKGIYKTVSTGSEWIKGSVPAPVIDLSFGFARQAKSWGTRTEDGRYAMIGCVPGRDVELRKRWPLAVTTSSDGLTFDTPHLVIAGDIPIQRYENARGDNKNSGPQYVRGISPGNGNPPGTDLWLTYSMNKEDIWIACVPTPITGEIKGDLNDDFQHHAPGKYIKGWNTYNPQWAPVSISSERSNRFLRLEDSDPFDYASVMRVFDQSSSVRLAFDVRTNKTDSTSEPFEIDVVSGTGTRAVAIALDPRYSRVTAYDGKTLQPASSYSKGDWIKVEIIIDGKSQEYDLKVNGGLVLENAAFLESATNVERIVFRTGEFRLRNYIRRPHAKNNYLEDRIPNPDVKLPTICFDLDNFSSGEPIESAAKPKAEAIVEVEAPPPVASLSQKGIVR